MRRWTLVVLAIALIGSGPVGADDPAPRERHDFASKLGKVAEGMSVEQTTEMLGPPDAVRKASAGGIHTTDTSEIWSYGTRGRSAFPVLGCVYFDKAHRVKYVYGGGTPATPRDMDEEQLGGLLRMIALLPDHGSRFDPTRVIDVVNALQPLGRERAVQVMREFARVASPWHAPGRQGLFWVVRCLFDVPAEPGFQPRLGLGAPIPDEPADAKVLPRFPVALVGDIPVLTVTGYLLGGLAERIEDHLDRLDKYGPFRAKPLAPAARPEQALRTLLARLDEAPLRGGPTTHAGARKLRRGLILRQVRSALGLGDLDWMATLPQPEGELGRPVRGLRMAAQVPRFLEAGCDLPIRVRLVNDGPLPDGVRAFNAFLPGASLEVTLRPLEGKTVRTLRPADPTGGMLALDTGDQAIPLDVDDVRLPPFATTVPTIVAGKRIATGRYRVHVRLSQPGGNRWLDGGAKAWKRHGFWTGTLEADAGTIEMGTPWGRWIRLRPPSRLSIDEDLKIRYDAGQTLDEVVHVRNGHSIAGRYTRDGELVMLTGTPAQHAPNVMFDLRATPLPRPHVDYGIEIFQVAEVPVHMWHPGPESAGYETLFEKTYRIHLTPDLRRRLAK